MYFFSLPNGDFKFAADYTETYLRFMSVKKGDVVRKTSFSKSCIFHCRYSSISMYFFALFNQINDEIIIRNNKFNSRKIIIFKLGSTRK